MVEAKKEERRVSMVNAPEGVNTYTYLVLSMTILCACPQHIDNRVGTGKRLCKFTTLNLA